MVLAVLDDVRNGNQPDSMLPRKLVAVVSPSHRPVSVIYQLTDHSHGLQLGELAQVHRGLGVSKAADRAALGVAQGQDMSGAVKVLGSLGGVGKRAAGQGAVVGRDARGGAVGVVDRNRVCGLHEFLVVGDHQGQLEILEP